MSTVYYSPLSTILPTDALPEALGFVKDGLANLLDDVYFKDLQHSESTNGDAAQYDLTIVSLKALEVEIPGTGIFLVLNPDHVSGSTSEFPITVRYEWPVLAWLRAFDLETFSWQPGDFYQLVLTVLGLSDRQVVERALTVFVNAPNPIDQFVDDVNAFYGKAFPHPVGADPIGEVLDTIAADPQFGEGSALIIFAVYILDNTDLPATEERVEALFSSFFGGSVKDWFLRQITPRAEATLEIGAGIRFPRSVLVPLDMIGGSPLPDPAASLLIFDAGAFTFSTERGIGFDDTLAASLTPSQIGNTGFEIAITGAKLDLSRTTNIPEATADGRPEDFVGVFIESATIKLPAFFNEDGGNSSGHLTGKSLLIGTGGLSGTISLEAIDPNDTTPSLIRGRFGVGFELGLSAVSVTFQQNAITASEIKGYMLIPGLEDSDGNPAEIQIDVSISGDGNFSVTASEQQGITALSIPDIVDVQIDSLSVGRKEGRFFVAVAGALDFKDQGGALGKFIPDKIEIQKLLIWDDGQLELEGGTIVLPQAATLQIGPVGIAITAIHFGTLEQEHNGQLRKYAFFGFDGGLSIDPGGVDARGDGIKFYFTTDVGPGKPLHVFLRITSIAIDIVIPGSATPETAAVILSGYLSMKDDGMGSTEYIGGVSVSLPKLAIAGNAAMRYNPRLPSFLIDLGLEISVPILLGATGLGLYGFRGLLGMRYVAKKTAAGLTEDAQWWQYYKAKVAPDHREGIQVSKFSPEDGFSIGAGVSLATAPDAGLAFSSKIFFLLSLPEVFLLQGQGQILKQRIGLDTTQDPPFFALIAISSTSIEAAFGVDYNIPDGGEIAQIDAVLEMGFFWSNAAAWYINLGKDQPEDRRVQALLLTIFKSYYYLMLSSSGIRTGAGVSYELNKSIGPFRVELGAYLDVAGRISFKPLQIGGSIELGGHLGLSIFGIGFSFTASAALSGEAPRPFIISGQLKACVKILWSRKCVTISLTWTFSSDLNDSEVDLFLPDLSKSVQAVNVLTLESFPLYTQKNGGLPDPAALAGYVVPMDSYIDLELRQGVKPTNGHPSLQKFDPLGGSPNYTVYVPPQKAKSSQVRHQFELDSIEIMSWDPGANVWTPYDVYQAATPLQLAPFVQADLTTLAYGFWQKTDPTIYNKLRVLAQTPFSYMRPGTPYIPPEDLGIVVEDVLCAPEERRMECRDFADDIKFGQQSAQVLPGVWYSMPDVLYQIGPAAGAIILDPWQGVQNGLCVDHENTIHLLFPEPTARVELLLKTEAESVEVRWYRRVPVPNPYGNAPLYEWQVVRTDVVLAANLTQPVRYDDLSRPILRADIRGLRCIRRPTGGDLLPVLTAIERFLNELARRGDLVRKLVTLYPEEGQPPLVTRIFDRILRRTPSGIKGIRQHTYFDSFLDGLLYKFVKEVEFVRYEVESATRTALRAHISDSLGYRCAYELFSHDGKPIDWGRIRQVRGLRTVPGELHDFIAEVVIDDDLLRFVRGRTCHVTQEPPGGEIPRHCDSDKEMTADGRALLELLEALREHKHLLVPTLVIVPEHAETYDQVFLRSPLYDIEATGAKRIVYEAMWEREAGVLLIRIRDFRSYDCQIRLAGPTDGETLDFAKIEKFLDLRFDPAGDADGLIYDFRLLAVIDQKEVWLIGRSGYSLGQCHQGCRTCLYRVCYETVEAAIENDSAPTPQEVEAEAQAMVEALSGSIQPIWRPDTNFLLRVAARDVATRYDDGNVLRTYANTFFFGWRTSGPLGHFHRYPDAGGAMQTIPAYAALEAAGREDEFKLASLQHYLDFPRCYPNADGRLTNAKPLFYVGPRLDLFYVRPYVYEMYRDWDAYNGAEKIWSSLQLQIVDPAPPPAAPPIPAVEASWDAATPTHEQPEVVVVEALIMTGDACGDVPLPTDGVDVVTGFVIPRLEPLKLYTAVFRHVFRRDSAADPSKQEVHRYVFQTSRYPNFGAQIGSWILESDGLAIVRSAVYDVEVDADAAALSAATAVLTDPATSSDDLKQRFADPFDRLIDGILRLETLPPAVTTEFNAIRLRGSTRVLGILVRCPEPLNDPKMPAAELAQTVTLSIDGGPVSAYRGLHAKDAARVFVTNANHALNVPAGSHRFTFEFRRWGGTAYVTEASATAEFARS